MDDQYTNGDTAAAPAGKCVEVELLPDGTFIVSPCEPKGEMMDGEEGAEPTGESYASMDEALQAAAALLTDDTRSEADAQMAGYQKGAKPDRPSVNAVFGE